MPEDYYKQHKKDKRDPDASELNRDIIRLSYKYGFIRQFIALYLHGEVTWTETLEHIIVAMMREYEDQGQLLMEVTQENFDLAKQLPSLLYEQPKVPTLPERSDS